MRKRRRSITIINNEIDYDKLAEAIVKAQRKAEVDEHETKIQKSEKITIKEFWELVKCIVFNKKQPNGTMTSGIFGGLLTIVFNILAIVGCVIAVLVVATLVVFCENSNWAWVTASSNIFVIILLLCVILMVLLFALLFRGAANEFAVEKDRNYIVSVFSGVVSFVALVVALITSFNPVSQ